MSYNLFLDDLRMPRQAYVYTQFEPLLSEAWVIVRDYEGFVKTLLEKGLPKLVSFDHDLHPEHYTPEEYWSDYAKSKAYQESQVYEYETGEACAYYLIGVCKIEKKPLPEYYCHSQNPVGKDWIMKPLDKNKPLLLDAYGN